VPEDKQVLDLEDPMVEESDDYEDAETPIVLTPDVINLLANMIVMVSDRYTETMFESPGGSENSSSEHNGIDSEIPAVQETSTASAARNSATSSQVQEQQGNKKVGQVSSRIEESGRRKKDDGAGFIGTGGHAEKFGGSGGQRYGDELGDSSSVVVRPGRSGGEGDSDMVTVRPGHPNLINKHDGTPNQVQGNTMDDVILHQHQELGKVTQHYPLGRRQDNSNNINDYGGSQTQGQLLNMDVVMTTVDVATHRSIISPPPALLVAQAHMDAYSKTFIAAKWVQACAKMFGSKHKKESRTNDMEDTPTRKNDGHTNQPSPGIGNLEVVDPLVIGRFREPGVSTQPPDIIPSPVVRANLDLSSWKLKFQDPLRQFKPRKLYNQPVIRMGQSRACQYKTRVAIEITVPRKSNEKGRQGQTWLWRTSKGNVIRIFHASSLIKLSIVNLCSSDFVESYTILLLAIGSILHGEDGLKLPRGRKGILINDLVLEREAYKRISGSDVVQMAAHNNKKRREDSKVGRQSQNVSFNFQKQMAQKQTLKIIKTIQKLHSRCVAYKILSKEQVVKYEYLHWSRDLLTNSRLLETMT
jgi:hypothetical protein